MRLLSDMFQRDASAILGAASANPYSAAISAGIQGATGIYQLIDGINKEAQAKKIRKETKRPVYNTSDFAKDSYNLAVAGLSNNEQEQFINDTINRGLSNSIFNAQMSGGDSDADTLFGGSVGNALSNATQMLIRESNMKRQEYYQQAANMAQEADKEFQINKFAPFADAMQLAALKEAKAERQVSEGITNIGGAVANYGIAKTKPNAGIDTGERDNATTPVPQLNTNYIPIKIPQPQLNTNLTRPIQIRPLALDAALGLNLGDNYYSYKDDPNFY